MQGHLTWLDSYQQLDDFVPKNRFLFGQCCVRGDILSRETSILAQICILFLRQEKTGAL